MTRRAFVLLVALLCAAAAPVFAQGRQSGSLGGRLTSADGQPLPGVTIIVSSAALQGQRSAITDVNGVYSVPGLPAGEYVVKFELSGMATVEGRASIALGASITLDRQMQPGFEETVDVRASKPAPVSSPAGAFNLRHEDIQRLPMGRTPFFAAEISPGLTDNTPNNNQVTVGGGFAYDNVFLMNGVDINDNVLGQPNALFIEDAIEEVQVLSSGISAEYGRFSGGVVNIITKSGGDRYSGAFRVNLTNPAWSDETPFEQSRHTTRVSKLSPTYEATLGGPLLRDRLWFFGGTRIERTTTQGAFAQTGTPYTSKNDNTRYEAKLTGRAGLAHTIQGSFIDSTTDLVQPAFGGSIEPVTMTAPSTPNRLLAANWRGVLGARTFVTAQYSQKWWKLENAGGTSTSIFDSPFLTRGTLGVPAGLNYHAQYFDSTDPEERNNRQLTGSVTQLFASPRYGSHELKGGFEYFVSTRVGGNSQTSTGYVFQTDYKLDASGQPAMDAQGRLIPRFVPGNSRVQVWQPLRGANIDVTTASLFVTDHVTLGARLSVDLGLRYETVGSEATGGIESVDTQTLAPRLAAAYDLTGDGRTILQSTYGHYVGKYNDVQFSRNTNVGNADRYTAQYTGPAGEGRDFTAGYDPANYTPISGTFPTANVFFDDDLHSPLTREYTLAVARDFGRHSWARATFIDRHATNFVEDFITIEGGQTVVNRPGVSGAFDNQVYRNTDQVKRDYRGLDFQAAYRFGTDLTVQGQWGVQLNNEGNFEGETANNPAIASLVGDYPEIYFLDRSAPEGRLDDFQRHKVRLWAVYTLDMNRVGRLDIAPLYRFNSGRTYSLVASVPLTAAQIASNPGYARLPTSQPVFFGARGSQSFEGVQLFDVGVTYGVPVWQSLRPWVKLEVLNAFNNQKLISWDTTVTANAAGAKDANGLPLEYVTGPNYGKATSNGNYPRPRQGMDGGRTFILAAGIRF